MRMIILAAAAALSLAAAADAPGLAATGQHFPMAKPVDEIRLCGTRPTAAGRWHCVGRNRKNVDIREGTEVSRTFRQIEWTWVKGGVTTQDSWAASK